MLSFNFLTITNSAELICKSVCARQDLFLDTHGVKLGFMSAFVKAAGDALQKARQLLRQLLQRFHMPQLFISGSANHLLTWCSFFEGAFKTCRSCTL